MSRRRRGSGRTTSPATRTKSSSAADNLHDTPADQGLDRLADQALFTGEIAVGVWRGQRVAVVPDLFEVLAYSQDLPMPETLRLVRTDGRAVRVYHWPADIAWPKHLVGS